MYMTLADAASSLELDFTYLMQLLQKGQIQAFWVEGDWVVNTQQFDFLLKQREGLVKDYQDYLDQLILPDIDIKDED